MQLRHSPASPHPLIRNSAMLVGVELLSKVLGLMFFIVMARYLGAEELGIYAFALTLANFFAIGPRFGFEKLVQREVGKTGQLLRGTLLELTAVKGILSLVAMSALFLTLRLVLPMHTLSGMLISSFVFAYAYLEFLNAIFRGLQRPEYEVVSRSLFSSVNLAVGLVALVAGGRLAAIALGQVGSVTVAVTASLLILREYCQESIPNYGWKRLQDHVKKAAPLGGVLVALYFSNQMGILVLGTIAGEWEAGYFAAAMRVFDNLTLVAAAVMGAFLPRASSLYQGPPEVFSRACECVTGQIFALALPMGLGLAILAEPIVDLLYGPAFSPSVGSMRVLGLTLCFSYWNYLADSLLIATDREGLLFRLTCIAAAVHVVSNVVLVSLYIQLGAALSVAVTQVSYCILLTFHIRDCLSLNRLGELLWRPALCTLGMAGGVYWMQDIHVLYRVFLGAAFYGGGMFLTGAFPVGDWLTAWKTWTEKSSEK